MANVVEWQLRHVPGDCEVRVLPACDGEVVGGRVDFDAVWEGLSALASHILLVGGAGSPPDIHLSVVHCQQQQSSGQFLLRMGSGRLVRMLERMPR